ncbi:MAG: zinc-dependent metalloprotease, partial [Cyclobacteriaceae bacterium]|nr:zinc-dependent metalloprotease [Cyclobacteriaceae bacterium]
RVVKFMKAGNKLLLVQPNQRYRAISNNPDEVRAVEEAFAQSVLWGFKIESETSGTYKINITDFLLQDAHNVTGRLSRTKQGNYKLDKNRSALYLPRTKNFPKNSEFETILTFTGMPQGGYIRSVAPTSNSITVRQHHSFVELPDNNYEPRVFDPRAGYFGMSYMDYATPISEPIVKRFINRHRLTKKDPNAEISEPVEPIIYYLDRGAPEPIRSALMDGAKWWNQAFEAAGYKDAFQVKLLPEGADPLDVRYNVIQWVHRSTRGWSYGSSVTDPRTGEIIKGHVSLGSLRVRQDFLIAEGLLAPYENGTEVPKEMEEMALARLRQLSAHEVGHTIGLAHSYTSSTENRASVMDYPHPLAEIENGKITLKNAYDDKIGAWDKVSISYGYQDFPEGVNEKEKLDEIIQNSLKSGLTFLSDQDARPQGGAHPNAHLWDSGTKAYEELNRVMKVRQVALDNFGKNNIRKNVPYAYLEEVLVPIYYFHRYQLEAAVKYIGGLNYRYALRGDGQLITEFISGEEQEKALNTIINTLKPENLALSEEILSIIPPRPIGYYRSKELPNIKTTLTVDAISMAEAASDMAMELIFHTSRANRLVEYNARNPQQPGLSKVIDILVSATWKTARKKGYHREVQHVTEVSMLNSLFDLGVDNRCTSQVKAIVLYKLEELQKWIIENIAKDVEHFNWVNHQIELFKTSPDKFETENIIELPAGSPIGTNLNCSH